MYATAIRVSANDQLIALIGRSRISEGARSMLPGTVRTLGLRDGETPRARLSRSWLHATPVAVGGHGRLLSVGRDILKSVPDRVVRDQAESAGQRSRCR